MDSLPSEPPGKPSSSGVGSLSLLQGIVPTQKSNWGLPPCRQILYQLSYQDSYVCVYIYIYICVYVCVCVCVCECVWYIGILWAKIINVYTVSTCTLMFLHSHHPHLDEDRDHLSIPAGSCLPPPSPQRWWCSTSFAWFCCATFHYMKRTRFIHPTIDGICVISSLGLWYLLLLRTIFRHIYCWAHHSILLRIYLGVELLSQR